MDPPVVLGLSILWGPFFKFWRFGIIFQVSVFCFYFFACSVWGKYFHQDEEKTELKFSLSYRDVAGGVGNPH